jgi:hypothetical protein
LHSGEIKSFKLAYAAFIAKAGQHTPVKFWKLIRNAYCTPAAMPAAMPAAEPADWAEVLLAKAVLA